MCPCLFGWKTRERERESESERARERGRERERERERESEREGGDGDRDQGLMVIVLSPVHKRTKTINEIKLFVNGTGVGWKAGIRRPVESAARRPSARRRAAPLAHCLLHNNSA